MHLENEAVMQYLRGYNSVRDGVLRSLILSSEEDAIVVTLKFAMNRAADYREISLELRGLQEINLYENESYLSEIALVKCLWTEAQEFYLSLDPYDEREAFVTERDNYSFRAKSVKLLFGERRV